jgi:hypothetical protein
MEQTESQALLPGVERRVQSLGSMELRIKVLAEQFETCRGEVRALRNHVRRLEYSISGKQERERRRGRPLKNPVRPAKVGGVEKALRTALNRRIRHIDACRAAFAEIDVSGLPELEAVKALVNRMR